MNCEPPVPNCESFEILRDEVGREVARVVTPSGVVGYVATKMPDEVLTAFMK
jgi:hypothetical protein